VVWGIGSAVGVAIVAIPDTGGRVVSFSDEHGPSAPDLLGVAILVGAWLPIASMLWRGRHSLAAGDGRSCRVLALVGIAWLTVSIAFNLGDWWVLAVVILVAAQAWALRIVAANRGPS
jgi:hypothetical protein